MSRSSMNFSQRSTQIQDEESAGLGDEAGAGEAKASLLSLEGMKQMFMKVLGFLTWTAVGERAPEPRC